MERLRDSAKVAHNHAVQAASWLGNWSEMESNLNYLAASTS